MAQNIINTRIKLKIDTYANWTANDIVLLAGEVAICTVPAESGAVQQEPSVLMKVGDGTHKFSELNWVSGLAANVHSWALGDSKPTYAADEITGLADFINGEIEDTDTQYKIEQDSTNPRIFRLYSKTKDGSYSTTAQNTITIPADTLVTGTANGTVKFNDTDVAVKGLGSAAYTNSTAYDASGSASTALSTAKTYTDTQVEAVNDTIGTVTDGKTVVEMIAEAQVAATYDDTALANRVSANEMAIGTLNGTGNGSVSKTVADAIAGVIANADEDFDTLKEIADWIASDTTRAAELQSKVSANETAIGTLNGADTVTGSVAKSIKDAKTDITSDYTTKLTNKVDKVTGKGLSTNDYTTNEKTKLIGIETGAQVNVIETIKKNGVVLAVTDKAVDITIKTTDIKQDANDVLIFNCGSSTTVI